MEQKGKLPDFVNSNELASHSNGGRILFATDDFFAVAENLLKDEEPVWKEGLFTEFGKWMDGWETRRRRCAGHDWAIIALESSSSIEGICVDTAYFTGNYAPKFSLLAANIVESGSTVYQVRDDKMGTGATQEDFHRISRLKSEHWTTLVPPQELRAGYPERRRHYVPISSGERWNRLRLNVFPDGGIARLRVYGLTMPDWQTFPKSLTIDLVSKVNAGVCLEYSDAHYGHPRNLIKPGKSSGMADGWETARRLDRPSVVKVDSEGIVQMRGEEWAIFKLGCKGRITRIDVDTKHFKGNYPNSVRLESALIADPSDPVRWRTILPAKSLSPDTKHIYWLDSDVAHDTATHVKVIIAPDGGFSRLKIWGFRV
ncbi:hypothetical protein KM043_006277 [Ampulex compressa]|nr:hypothetical protein KM043_006277 [Ampulex compressa]